LLNRRVLEEEAIQREAVLGKANLKDSTAD